MPGLRNRICPAWGCDTLCTKFWVKFGEKTQCLEYIDSSCEYHYINHHYDGEKLLTDEEVDILDVLDS